MDCYQCILSYWFMSLRAAAVKAGHYMQWTVYPSQKKNAFERSRGEREDILRMRHFVMFFSSI